MHASSVSSSNTTSDDTAVINKLRKHLCYQRERNEIGNLIKEAMLKSNFNPTDEPVEATAKSKLNEANLAKSKLASACRSPNGKSKQ